jgi:hypothetical protein
MPLGKELVMIFVFIIPNFKNAPSILKPVEARRINLNEIQPNHKYLVNATVNYFLKNPGKIFKQVVPIRIYESSSGLFKYWAIDGNHRLYALWKKGIEYGILIPEIKYSQMTNRNPAPILPFSDFEQSIIDEAYSQGIRRWKDVCLISKQEYENILMEEDDLPSRIISDKASLDEKEIRRLKYLLKTQH